MLNVFSLAEGLQSSHAVRGCRTRGHLLADAGVRVHVSQSCGQLGRRYCSASRQGGISVAGKYLMLAGVSRLKCRAYCN